MAKEMREIHEVIVIRNIRENMLDYLDSLLDWFVQSDQFWTIKLIPVFIATLDESLAVRVIGHRSVDVTDYFHSVFLSMREVGFEPTWAFANSF